MQPQFQQMAVRDGLRQGIRRETGLFGLDEGMGNKFDRALESICSADARECALAKDFR
jgi:hypothetical protein